MNRITAHKYKRTHSLAIELMMQTENSLHVAVLTQMCREQENCMCTKMKNQVTPCFLSHPLVSYPLPDVFAFAVLRSRAISPISLRSLCHERSPPPFSIKTHIVTSAVCLMDTWVRWKLTASGYKPVYLNNFLFKGSADCCLVISAHRSCLL